MQTTAVQIIQSYGEFRKNAAFLQGMMDYQNGIAKELPGYDGQCYDRGQECQMKIDRIS